MSFSIANGYGDSIDMPSMAQMRSFLAALDPADEEHGAAWLTTEDEISLEWNVDGRLVLSIPDADEDRHLVGVSRDRAAELWAALAGEGLAAIEHLPWARGNGFVLTPERSLEMNRWQTEQDRVFYEALGPERPDVGCRSCERGAVAHSVLCRVHHFESIKGRRCPFSD